MTPEPVETQKQLQGFIDVVNNTISEQSDALLKSGVAVATQLVNGKTIGAAIQKRGVTEPHDYYTLKVTNGKILIDQHGRNSNVDHEMTLSPDYMQEVIDEKSKFIENPMALDWAWLRDQVKNRVS